MLNQFYEQLFPKYFPESKISENIYSEIIANYNIKTRFYHSTNHILMLLQEIENLKHELNDVDVVLFAIWFHDVVYFPLKKNNEEKSAEFAEKKLQQSNLQISRRKQVSDLILQTKFHIPKPLLKENFDLLTFLDADLMILGSETEKYEEYKNAVRKEYSMIPSLIYKKSRTEVLQKFLERTQIFQTPYFFEKYELKARRNIENEITAI